MDKQKVLLMILDGWGLGDGSEADVIKPVSYTHLTLPTTPYV
jgi:bisphosphoglycerate-independent phosphoglycerate mutase (AlkP superfamily)